MVGKSKNKVNTSRRDFVKKTAALAISSLTLPLAFSSCKSDQNQEKEKVKVKVLTQDGQIVEISKDQLNGLTPAANRIEARQGIPGRSFVMVIDLSRCRNARKCVEGCQEMHHLRPQMEFMKVFLMKDSKNTSPYWMPKPCFHCDKPPCVSLCPVGATYKRTDGIVLIDTHKCIGCKFCMTACPYSSRVFEWEKTKDKPGEVVQEYSPENGLPAVHGTVRKCDFCPDMARQSVLPSCVTACPNGVIYYGDANEDAVSNGAEIVRLSMLIKDKGAYHYEEELGTEPRVYYLPPVDRNFPVEEGLKNLTNEEKKRYRNVNIDL